MPNPSNLDVVPSVVLLTAGPHGGATPKGKPHYGTVIGHY